MKTSLTIFKSKYDSKTHKRMDFNSFDKFEKLLYELSSVKYTKKEDAPLISPATFATDDSDHPTKLKESDKRGKASPWYHRKNVNVLNWAGWACLDVDTWKPERNLKEEINDRFNNVRFVCYSTASSTDDNPKFRLVFALDDHLSHDKIRGFWHALVQWSGFEADPQCKDLSRMYYVPADYHISDATNSFIFSGRSRDPLNINELIEKYPPPPPRSNSFFDNLPPEIQAQIIEHKKKQLENTEVNWTSYRNCKYWPKRMASEYANISNSGWYHKLYQIMVALASNAIRDKYPITPIEIAQLCFEFDLDNGGWYKDRPLETEANRALEFVYRTA